jgi:catechol 2,3-dioxygenase-like lactoylglutathione lyase family enzyme
MAIVLNHTIVPARDKKAAARFFAQIFGLKCERAGYFAPVRVNEQTTLLFDDTDAFQSHHYAFHVSDPEFDAIFDPSRRRDSHTAARRKARITASSTIGVAAAGFISGIPTVTCWS